MQMAIKGLPSLPVSHLIFYPLSINVFPEIKTFFHVMKSISMSINMTGR